MRGDACYWMIVAGDGTWCPMTRNGRFHIYESKDQAVNAMLSLKHKSNFGMMVRPIIVEVLSEPNPAHVIHAIEHP